MIANHRAPRLAAVVVVGLELISWITIVKAQPLRLETPVVITDQAPSRQEAQEAPLEDSTQTQALPSQNDYFRNEFDRSLSQPPLTIQDQDQQSDSFATLSSQFAQSDFSQFSEQLETLPYMFGDSFAQGAQVFVNDGVGTATADLALAGGSRRAKIAENNKALPEDRLFLIYNHFHNAVDADASDFVVGPDRRSISIERFTLGFEKAFLCRSASVDVRLPVTNGYEFNTPNFAVAGSEAGNLAIQLKVLLACNRSSTLVAGTGIDLPTGADAFGQVNGTFFQLNNDAVHLSPYLGASYVPTTRTFHQAFVQVDFATEGNSINVISPFLPPVGTLREQDLLYVDYEFGTWLYRNCQPDPRRLKGLASVIELHYTSTLDDADTVTSFVFPTDFTFTNLANRVDVLNLTTGLHGEFASGASARIGCVFPLRKDDDRFFDAEIQASVNLEF